MFRLQHETMNVCQPNVARFVHMVCRFDKIKVIFLGLRFTFDARANLSLVQIKVIYDYYSSKRIIPFFIGEEELLSTIFELSRNAL